ncbi:MAG: hypothetical protein ACI9J2_000912 [Saprospiraceae bacterium]
MKRPAGGDARIWDIVYAEVYTPAGIHHPIKFHTIEADPAREAPLSQSGLLLTMDNIAGLGKLILDGGKISDEQILNPQILSEWFEPKTPKGLPTEIQTQDGEVHYCGGFWHVPHESFKGKKGWIPSMRGYGGQIIHPLPNGMTAFRLGFDSVTSGERYDGVNVTRLADSIKPFE